MGNFKRTSLWTLVLTIVVSQLALSAHGQLSVDDGVIPAKKLPKPVIKDELVLLNVPHIKQKDGYCVPTSCAMILRYFGHKDSPNELKKLAENHKPIEKRNTKFTYWKDMQVALKSKKYEWKITNYSVSKEGYEKGWGEIKEHLRKGLPVMVDVHLSSGHTFVLIGFNDDEQLVYIRDPWIPRSKARVLTYDQMQQHWHNHQYSKSRSAFFPSKHREAPENEKS